ncbi:MAG: hypothetical protein ACPF9Q_07465, partial [Opitutales bacterium]
MVTVVVELLGIQEFGGGADREEAVIKKGILQYLWQLRSFSIKAARSGVLAEAVWIDGLAMRRAPRSSIVGARTLRRRWISPSSKVAASGALQLRSVLVRISEGMTTRSALFLSIAI